MKTKMYVLVLLLLGFSTVLAQEIKNKDKKVNETVQTKTPNTTLSTGDEINFKDDEANTLITITDEGTVGSITLPSGSAPSTTANKLYNIGTSLFWNGSALGISVSSGWTDDGTVVRLTNSTDKVGIGTNTPLVNLDIRGASIDDAGIIYLGNSDRSHILDFFPGKETDPNPFVRWKSEDPLRFATDGDGFKEYMRIASNGNVGIGTTDPQSLLSVGGNGSSSYSIYGTNSNLGGVAVYGDASNTGNARNYGGHFTASGTDGVGVHGSASGTLGRGVYGYAGGANAYGVYGYASDDYGRGVYGYAPATTGYAGYFDGHLNATGNITGASKSFKIDHPLDPQNKYLLHTSVESPDMMNIYNGNVVLDGNGEAVVVMKDWFEALNMDFRYQLTCIGGFSPVYIAEEINNNQFKIAGGTSGMKVSWQVTGIRHDAYANANRIPVEEMKKEKERGKYLHPEAFNMPKTAGVDYDERMEEERMRMKEERVRMEEERTRMNGEK